MASSGWPSFLTSGSTATLTGASAGCSRSTVRALALDLVLVVRVDQEREHRAVGAGGRLDHVRDVALAGGRVDVLELLAGGLARAASGRSRRGWRSPRPPTSRSGTGTRRRWWRSSSARARPGRGRAAAGGRGAARGRCTSAAAPRASARTTSRAWSGGTKNSISICSNSRVRKMKFPVVISLRKLLPICAIPNGGFLRENCR